MIIIVFCYVVYTEHWYEDHDSLNYRELYSNRSFECGKKRNPNIAPYNSESHCENHASLPPCATLNTKPQEFKKEPTKNIYERPGRSLRLCGVSLRV